MAEENTQVEQGQEQQQQAPAVTVPVQEQKVPPQQENKEPPKQEEESYEYEPTGDAKLDVVLSFLAQHKLGADHPAVQAAVKGDFGLLKAELAQRGAQGYEAMLGLAQEVYEADQKALQEKEQSIVQAVSDTLARHGYSNEQWGETIAWAKEQATEDEVAELNKLLQSPLGAKAVTSYLIGLHREAAGVEFKPQQQAVKPDAGAETPSKPQSQAPISAMEFAREAEKLAKTYGPDYMSRPEYRQLRQRRGLIR